MLIKSILPSALIALGTVVAGFALRSGIVAFKDRDRQVSVKGLAEREVKADKVTWSLVYKELGNDPTEMYNILKQKNQTVVNFLKQGGLKDEEISVNPPAVTDREANDYNSTPAPFRYKATSTITITSRNVEKVRALMNRQSELMRSGIPLITDEFGAQNVTYDFTGLNEIKPAMVEEATKNARATAEKFAADSGSEIGKIKSASQGQFSIENRDPNTPYIKNVRVVITMQYQLED